MSVEQIHFDLRKNLHAKIRRAVSDHLQLCEIAEIRGTDAAAGIGDVLIHLCSSFFSDLELSPQEFAKLCLQNYREVQKERA
jgi:hypothetical protein